jgi:hypothetical protein
MPELYGRNWTKDELRRRSGRMRALFGVTRSTLQEGLERGVEICDVRTGSGFRFVVSPSRGLDIVFAEHNGRPLCWNSSTGFPHPAYYEAGNLGWLRGFGGGLLTTCGLGSFGKPSEDSGEYWGLHDRISYLPAENVRTEEIWHGDQCELVVEGTVRQTRVFGANLTLTRRISAFAGENHLTVHDRIENEGFQAAPAVILYHCNFGFPVVSEDSVIEMPSAHSEPRDEAAEVGADEWAELESPQPDYAERCYFHAVSADENGYARASIRNQKLGFGAYIRYKTAELPYFTQWKMMGAGDYVCGLEPSNAFLTSRAELRERGELPVLQPGEAREFTVELGVL